MFEGGSLILGTGKQILILIIILMLIMAHACSAFFVRAKRCVTLHNRSRGRLHSYAYFTGGDTEAQRGDGHAQNRARRSCDWKAHSIAPGAQPTCALSITEGFLLLETEFIVISHVYVPGNVLRTHCTGGLLLFLVSKWGN